MEKLVKIYFIHQIVISLQYFQIEICIFIDYQNDLLFYLTPNSRDNSIQKENQLNQ